jgi:hypothetical protein
MGTAVGASGLSLVAPASLTKLFALLILVVVLVSLIGTGVRVSRRALLAGGGAAGVMGTMVGIHGPPIALVFQNAEPAQARAMLGAFFAVGYATSVIALFAVGLFGRQELTVGLLLLPGVGIGYATAPLVGRFVDRRRLRIAILTISGASAIALALRCNLRSVPIGTTASRGSALKPGRAVWLREASANVPACAPRPLRNHAQHGGTKAVFEMTYAGRLAMFAIRVSYPGGHSVWLTRRFPTVAWGLKKDALPFPTEADAARTIARLRPSGPVSIEPIAPEIAKPA